MIRAIPTNSADRIYCKILGQGAVHGAFAGYTDFTVGLVNTHYVYLPIPVIIQAPRVVDPQGRQWNRLKTAIKKPDLILSFFFCGWVGRGGGESRGRRQVFFFISLRFSFLCQKRWRKEKKKTSYPLVCHLL